MGYGLSEAEAGIYDDVVDACGGALRTDVGEVLMHLCNYIRILRILLHGLRGALHMHGYVWDL